MSRQQRKPIFFTSDWHIGHKKVIEFDNRPFRDIDHMHEFLIRNYNSTVPKDGICYFLGDIGMAKSEVIFNVISQLNGTKICIKGNHDGSDTMLYKSGFDVVLTGARLQIAGCDVTMSHCPLLGIRREDTTRIETGTSPEENWHGESRETHFPLSFLPEACDYHIHGHIHSPNGGKSETILHNQRDVGVPGNNYKPVSYSTIEKWIQKDQHEIKTGKKLKEFFKK